MFYFNGISRRMKRFRPIVLLLAVACPHGGSPSQSLTSARSHLERGLRLARAYNWVDAAPNFVEAERLFVAERDDKGAYYARLGRIRSTMERGGPLPEVIFRLQGDLDSIPFLKSDPQIRIFCLIVKGDFDGESDHGAMARDWEE